MCACVYVVCWCAGVLVCWCVGVLVCWCVGALVCWCVGCVHKPVGTEDVLGKAKN